MTSVLGIFGGTFDPIHCAHLELAREVRDALDLAAIRFIPAGDPPHRAAPVASAMHRLAMVELAVADRPGFEVDPREIERRGRSYTVATLAELRVEAPERPLGMLVGADAFLGLPGWHRWTEIFDLAHVIVVGRPGVVLEGTLSPPLAHQWTRRFRDDPTALSREPAGSIVMQSITPHEIAASAIRAQLARGAEGVNAVRGLLPAAVLAYIDRNQLYRSRPDAP